MAPDDTDAKYPDLVAEQPPQGFAKLSPVKAVAAVNAERRAKRIKWGEDYRAWPVERRLKFAEDLAASMNHAADVLQQERDRLVVIAKHQEEQLKLAALRTQALADQMRDEMAKADAEKQGLYAELVKLKAILRKAAERALTAEAELKALKQQEASGAHIG